MCDNPEWLYLSDDREGGQRRRGEKDGFRRYRLLMLQNNPKGSTYYGDKTHNLFLVAQKKTHTFPCLLLPNTVTWVFSASFIKNDTVVCRSEHLICAGMTNMDSRF